LKRVYRAILVGMSVLMLAAPVAAQSGSGDSPVPTPTPPASVPITVNPADVPALPGFLEQLAGPAGWVSIGVLASMLLARWPWYNQQSSELKRAIPIVISATVSVAARLLVTYVPVEVFEILAPYWLIVAGAVMTWLGSQGWFRMAVKTK